MADVVDPNKSNIDARPEHPLPIVNGNFVLLAFDAEGKGAKASEFEFAWIDVFDVFSEAPEKKAEKWRKNGDHSFGQGIGCDDL